MAVGTEHTVTGPFGDPPPAHAFRSPLPVVRLVAAVASGCVLVGTLGLVASTLLTDETGQSTSTPSSARLITVSTPIPAPTRR